MSLLLSSGTFPVSFSQGDFLRSSLKSMHCLHRLRPPGGARPCLGFCRQQDMSSQVPEGSVLHVGAETPACGPKSSTCTAGDWAEAVSGSGASPLPQTQTVFCDSLAVLCEGLMSCCTCVSSCYTCSYCTPASHMGLCSSGLLLSGRCLCIWSAAPGRGANGKSLTVGFVGR